MTWFNKQVAQARNRNIGLRLDHWLADKRLLKGAHRLQITNLANLIEEGNFDHTAGVITLSTTSTVAAATIATIADNSTITNTAAEKLQQPSISDTATFGLMIDRFSLVLIATVAFFPFTMAAMSGQCARL